MNKSQFETILTKCCEQLTKEARLSGFTSAATFESRVRELLAELSHGDKSFSFNFDPHPQAFPDIAMGEFGAEVKFTLASA